MYLNFIDLEMVEKLAKLYCTQKEIADVMKFNVKNFERKKDLLDAYNCGISQCKTFIRERQMALAEQNNPQILIWLGKQILGQKDRHEISSEEAISIRIGFKDDDKKEDIIEGVANEVKELAETE